MINNGDCRDILRRMIAEGVRVQMCVTSPPYWGLRDYGTATWEGGRKRCDHKRGYAVVSANGKRRGTGGVYANTNHAEQPYRSACGKCGARRIDQQLGLEATPEEFIANLVDVFRLVREVLADGGTLWVNMGDSYVGGGGGFSPQGGLKPKDLCGMPWRLAFALQADGWWLRSDIIWHKPNAMPESVKDRPTRAHEYLFLFSKSERYYYDHEAIQEPVQPAALQAGCMRNKRTVWTIPTGAYSEAHRATFPRKLVEPCILAGSRVGDIVLDPFFGSGTVGQVAQHLGRQWIGIDINPEYARMQKRRTAQTSLVLETGR